MPDTGTNRVLQAGRGRHLKAEILFSVFNCSPAIERGQRRGKITALPSAVTNVLSDQKAVSSRLMPSIFRSK